MWKNILSYIWKFSGDSATELSLEGACSILKEKNEDNNRSISNSKKQDTITNNFCIKKGIITKHEGNNCVIDNVHSFTADKISFPIGSKVSYSVYTCDKKENIINVNLIENDWDFTETCDLLWNTRIIICKVEKRINRKLVLSPGDITIDLNNVSIEFLPVVGDWLELDIKCSINETAIDLSGQLIEINKISPVRLHIEEGVVTKWSQGEKEGIINKNIHFNKYSLSHGYIPIIGDKVITEIIESDQNRCSWRSLKVIPEGIAKKNISADNLDKSTPEYVVNHPDLRIDSPILSFDKLNETCTFFITITNISKNNLLLLGIEFLKSTNQCKILDINELPAVISAGMLLKISCQCTAKSVGNSNELALLSFENFKMGKWINICVLIDVNEPTNHFEHRPRLSHHTPTGNGLVRGQRISAPPRFIATQLPPYTLPQKLLELGYKYDFKDIIVLTEELKAIKPSLFSNLTFTNYEDKFHTILHLDEIANLMMIRNYDQEKACFIASEDFLMLEIENLSERRPSIVLGDKIIATDPLNKNKVDFEGYVHKVGAKHIYIKFSPLFHDKYNGEDYSIRIVPSRSSYRRLHHAVYLAVRNLGKDILFPTRVLEKQVQANFIVDYCNTDSGEKKRMGPAGLLNRLIQIKNSNDVQENIDNTVLENTNLSKLKLEWYNTLLNPKQKDAVINVLLGIARPLPYIIFGPPGTGKTVTLIEVVLQIIRLLPHSRLLITAPSNSASDLIAIRLIESGILKPGDLVRLVSHNYALSDSIPVMLVPYCATGSLARDGTADTDVSTSGIQYECSRAMLGRHRITVSTCSSAGQLYAMGFPKGHFSHIIVDEAAQASEPEVLIPLAFLDKSSGQVILAGDPMQLGPVVLCKIAGECGLSESYLERLCNTFPYSRDPEGFHDNSGYDPRLVTKLLYNYRSLPCILKLTSCLFYDDELIPTIDDENSEEAILCQKLYEIIPKNGSTKASRVVFHGVNGVNYQSADSPSWYNPHEAAQVFYYINEFYRMGLASRQIGIITPYIKQVKEIRSLLTEAEFDVPKIGTVEEFQGQEFDVIVLSTVRSCQEHVSSDIVHSLGFVSSPRRLNVAISRSKALLIIVGDPHLLCYDTYWRSVIKYCFDNGSYTGCDFSF